MGSIGTETRRPTRAARLCTSTLALLPILSLGACIFGEKPLAGIDRPQPKLGAAGDLDDEALARVARTAEAGGMDATEVYRRIADRNPSAAAPRIALARQFQQRGDLAGAETEYRQAVSIAPKDVDARLGLAQLLYTRGNLRDAGAAYRGVLEVDAGNLRALNGYGAVLDNEGRREEAQAQYRRALEIDPRDRSARNNLGLSLALSGRFDEGIPVLEALAAEPGATDSHRANLTRARGLRTKAGGRRREAAERP